jgi:Tol biopolymer transport system component
MRALVQEPGAVYERPLWSPDGRYIAYSAIVPNKTGQGHQLFVYDTVAGASSQLQTNRLSSRFPTWMPDSKALVFSGYRATGGRLELFKFNLTHGSVNLLLTENGPEEKTQPVVSPDGQKVLYVGYATDPPDSNRDIYLLDLTTGQSQQLTTSSGLDWFPQWSPDGKSIYFESWRTGTFIWKMDADGSHQHQITRGQPTTRPFVGFIVGYLPINP